MENQEVKSLFSFLAFVTVWPGLLGVHKRPSCLGFLCGCGLQRNATVPGWKWLFFTHWDGLKKITKLNFERGSRKIASLIHSLWIPQIDTELVSFFFLFFLPFLGGSTFWQNTNLKISSALTQKSHFKEVFLPVHQCAPRQMPEAANCSGLQAKMH